MKLVNMLSVKITLEKMNLKNSMIIVNEKNIQKKFTVEKVLTILKILNNKGFFLWKKKMIFKKMINKLFMK
jgi:hypothetical protein